MSIVVVARLEAVVLRVRDLDRAIDWYSTTLGLSLAHRDDATGIAILRLEGAPLTLWRIPDAIAGTMETDRTGNAAFPIFAVRDAEAAHAALQDAGVTVSPLHEDLSVRWCEFTDLDGNRLEVCESVA